MVGGFFLMGIWSGWFEAVVEVRDVNGGDIYISSSSQKYFEG
jgi:hypothetical protein